MDFDNNARLHNGEYTEGGNGVLPSFITARTLNALTRALRNVVIAAGATPDIDAPDQVNAAIDTLISNAVAALVGSSPAALDTLNELAAALGNDPNFATTITNALAGKAPVVHTHAPADVGVRTAYKPESTDRNYTTSLSPDPDLQIYDLEYNSFYKIEGFLRITNPGSSQGTRILLIRDNSSGVLTNTAVNVSYVESTSDANSGFRRAARGHLVTIGGSVSSELFVKFSGFIVTGASGAPDWELSWGPSSASGSNTTFHKGSWIRAEKIS